MVRRVSWADKEDDPQVDREKFKVMRMPVSEVEEEMSREADQKVLARFHFKKTDVPGLQCNLEGHRRQPHPEACRNRLMEAMADDERKDTVDEILAKQVEQDLKCMTRSTKEHEMKGGGDMEGGAIASAAGGMNLQVLQPELREARSNERGLQQSCAGTRRCRVWPTEIEETEDGGAGGFGDEDERARWWTTLTWPNWMSTPTQRRPMSSTWTDEMLVLARQTTL